MVQVGRRQAPAGGSPTSRGRGSGQNDDLAHGSMSSAGSAGPARTRRPSSRWPRTTILRRATAVRCASFAASPAPGWRVAAHERPRRRAPRPAAVTGDGGDLDLVAGRREAPGDAQAARIRRGRVGDEDDRPQPRFGRLSPVIEGHARASGLVRRHEPNRRRPPGRELVLPVQLRSWLPVEHGPLLGPLLIAHRQERVDRGGRRGRDRRGRPGDRPRTSSRSRRSPVGRTPRSGRRP